MSKKFTPTPEMIAAAEQVFLCRANTGTIRPIVREYQTRILAEGQWKIRSEFAGRRGGDPDEIILNPDHSFLLSEADFALYHERCNEARRNAHLVVDDDAKCPLSVAEHAEAKATALFCKVMAPVSGINYERITSARCDLYNEFIELNLRLMGSYVRDAETLMCELQGKAGIAG